MVTIGMNYKVLPGKEEVFEKACTGVIETMKGIDGHEKSFLYKDVNDSQLRTGGLVFAIIGFIIIWYFKS